MVNFSLTHVGIQRFSSKLDGTLICTITPTNQIIKMPWSLKEIDSGSLNPRTLVNHLIQQILSIKQVSENAIKVTIKLK